MKKVPVILMAAMSACTTVIFAAPQNIVGPGGTVALNGSGQTEGVTFTAQNAGTPSTLTVAQGLNINTTFPTHASGVSTDLSGASNIIFQGTSGTSTVFGTVGATGLTIKDITVVPGTASVTFNGAVKTATLHLDAGTMQFNSSSSGALTFTGDGTLNVASGTTFTGAVVNQISNEGTVTLNSASTLSGAVGTAGSNGPVKQINVIGGNATLVGGTSATTFTLGTNTLFLTGTLALPTNAVINTTVISDTLFGNITETGADSVNAPVVTINVDASQALLSGAPLFIVSAQGTTSGVPIIVNSGGVRYSFIGNNLNGNITITPTLLNPGNTPAGNAVNALAAIAADNPGSDLAYVQLQLNALPTAAALANAYLQISPASGLVGVNRESFNVAKQFQKVWLEHLQRNREYCRLSSLDDCCNFPEKQRDACGKVIDPCLNDCENMTIWADGFGYYGHKDEQDQLNGYKVNTWGGMVAAETTLTGYLRGGLGVGYAFTDLDESKFKNGTDINTYQGTLYLTYDTNTWFVDGGFSFGWNHYDGERHINFTGVNRTAKAEYDGQEYTGFLAAGYRAYWNCFEITPLATLLYSHLDIEGYTEDDASSLDYHIKNQQYDYLQSGLGLKLAYVYKTGCGIFLPEVHSMWLHDFEEDKMNIRAKFIGLGGGAGSFKNMGPSVDENTWNIGASFAYLANDTFTVQVVYDYEQSENYFDQQGMLELSFDF